MPVIRLEGKSVRFAVAMRRRRRHPAIAIAEDGSFLVLLPADADPGDAVRLLRQESRWVLAHLSPPRSFAEGTMVPVLGEPWPLTWVDRPGRTKGRVELPRGAAHPREALVQWYRDLAERVFLARLAYFAPRIGVDYGPVWIRDYKSRWGCCHSSGRIGLNWRLVQAPPPILDYVVVHELCHRQVPNHGPDFYRRVAALLPEWKTARRWLNREGFRLYW